MNKLINSAGDKISPLYIETVMIIYHIEVKVVVLVLTNVKKLQLKSSQKCILGCNDIMCSCISREVHIRLPRRSHCGVSYL